MYPEPVQYTPGYNVIPDKSDTANRFVHIAAAAVLYAISLSAAQLFANTELSSTVPLPKT
jgi:hypothetical protein